jgi:dihydrofolate reductase
MTLMRKIILMMSISLDGFYEGPGQDLGWQKVDAELHSHFNEWLATAGAFLDGRITYDLMARVWPTADQNPGSTPQEAEFSRIWRDMPKIVYSRTLQHADWNTTIEREVVPDDVRKLKEQPGGDLVLGGADLAATFLRHDLIDEFRIYVHPVVIGQGKPLFRTDAHLELERAEVRPFGNGVVMLRYEDGAVLRSSGRR